jgi:DNA-binding FadR family transcriptional regulator
MQHMIVPNEIILDGWLQMDIAARRACEFRIASFAAMRADASERQSLKKVQDAILSAAQVGDAASVIHADQDYEFILAASGDHPVLGQKLKARKEAFRNAWRDPSLAQHLQTASQFRIGLTDAICRQEPAEAGQAINAFFDYLIRRKSITALFG